MPWKRQYNNNPSRDYYPLIHMRIKPNDKKGLGALGAIILVILLVAVAFVGGTAAMPYVVDQGFSVGDTIAYEMTDSDGTETVTYMWTDRVTAVNTTTVSWNSSYGDLYPSEDWVATIHKDGNKIYLGNFWDYWFIDPADLPDERSYTVLMVGFTPMIVEAYTWTDGNATADFWVKAGTLCIVKWVFTEGDNTITGILKEASLKWVMLI